MSIFYNYIFGECPLLEILWWLKVKSCKLRALNWELGNEILCTNSPLYVLSLLIRIISLFVLIIARREWSKRVYLFHHHGRSDGELIGEEIWASLDESNGVIVSGNRSCVPYDNTRLVRNNGLPHRGVRKCRWCNPRQVVTRTHAYAAQHNATHCPDTHKSHTYRSRKQPWERDTVMRNVYIGFRDRTISPSYLHNLFAFLLPDFIS